MKQGPTKGLISAIRYHDISVGHRVTGHEGKCRYWHGHNYRIHFMCCARRLDKVGRVLDFFAIKERLCLWLEENWDHRFLVWKKDPIAKALRETVYHSTTKNSVAVWDSFLESLVWVPFNPTAENMAEHLLRIVGPKQLKGTGVEVVKVTVDETRKCSASAER